MKLTKSIRPTKNGMTYDIDGDAVLLFPLATKLQDEFGLDAGHIPMFGLDGTYIELTKGDISITVGWDVWSDIFIMTHDEKGESLFKEIAEYLDKNLEMLGELEDQLIIEYKEKEDKEKKEENEK